MSLSSILSSLSLLLLIVSKVLTFSTLPICTGPVNDNVSAEKFEPLVRRPVVANKVNVYESTKDGVRFVFKQIDFDVPLSDLTGAKASLTLDLNKTRQKIDGFGGAFTDSACENLIKLPAKIRQQIVDDYFDKKNGLEYNLGRSTIGGSDFSSRVYTLDDIEYDYELRNFSLEMEDYDYKIPIIKMAMKHVPDLKIISTIWSPPVWLKTNKRINHRGGIVGLPTGKYYQTYANYFVKYLNAYKREGIKIFGISPANEPTNGRYIPFFPFNCVGFSATQMRDFIVQTLGPTLKANGYGKENLKLFIVDDQRLYLNRWVNTIMGHENASEYVTHVAFHWYFNSISSAKVLDPIKQKYPHLKIWSTEACSGSYTLIRKHVEIESWSRAEAYAKDITEDLNHMTSAWVDWNLALDMQGGPNWSGNYVDAPIIINLKENKYIRQPMFYALAHFTKFIKPNSLNLEQNLSVKGSKLSWFSTVYSTSFRTPENDIVVVVSNTYNVDVKFTINVPENRNQIIHHILPKRSITTFVWKA